MSKEKKTSNENYLAMRARLATFSLALDFLFIATNNPEFLIYLHLATPAALFLLKLIDFSLTNQLLQLYEDLEEKENPLFMYEQNYTFWEIIFLTFGISQNESNDEIKHELYVIRWTYVITLFFPLVALRHIQETVMAIKNNKNLLM